MNKDLLPLVATELEALRRKTAARFPPLCRYVVKSLPGNQSCVDCGAVAPDWASVTHGSLICLQCSGNHRSYGVHTSVVRSIDMDHWTHDQVLAMLEGGNGQLSLFFERHQMGRDSRAASHRASLPHQSGPLLSDAPDGPCCDPVSARVLSWTRGQSETVQ